MWGCCQFCGVYKNFICPSKAVSGWPESERIDALRVAGMLVSGCSGYRPGGAEQGGAGNKFMASAECLEV